MTTLPINNTMPSNDAFLGWIKQADGDGEYTLLNPRRLYRGKSYSDWATDWFNWFLSANADKRNFGPVVFLRSHGLPDVHTDPSKQVYGSDTPLATNITDPGYPTGYINKPNIRVGSDRLQIFEDQSVFVPIITSYVLGGTVAPYRDWGTMQDGTGLIIDNGDNPPNPDQLTIDNIPIKLEVNNENNKEKAELTMEDFRISTPIFTAVVPDAPYGTSVKDFLEEGSILAGVYPAMVDGYFVMLKFRKGTYWIHSWASAGREERGPYFSELLYQIEVDTRPQNVPHGSITTARPADNQGTFARMFEKKKKDHDLAGYVAKMEQYLGSMQQLKKTVQDKVKNQQTND